jgi:hypothetical protein
MADERDPNLSRRYAELGRDEPPAHVDAAILAAARRAAETRPAPLVPPTGRRKWYFPLAAAAVIVLAVAVTVQVEREQPDSDMPVAQSVRKEAAVEAKKPQVAEAPAAKSKVQAAPAAPAPAAPPSVPQAEEQAARDSAALSRSAPEAFSGPQPGTGAAAGARSDALERREAPAAAASAAPRPQARMMAKAQSPEQELERIAELRKQGRDEEADQALKEFRKRYPDFRISEEMLKRVEKN